MSHFTLSKPYIESDVMGGDVNGILVAVITVPAVVLICVFVVVSVAIMLILYHKKKAR